MTDSNFLYFNPTKVIPSFGLPNVGSICHFNSLYQSLMSCTSLIEKMPDNKMGSGMLKCLEDNNSILLSDVLRKSVESRKDIVKFTYGQQSASEGLVLILEQLGSKIEILFRNRTMKTIFCQDCNVSELSPSVMTPVSMMKSEEFILDIHNTYSGSIEDYVNFLISNLDTIRDYRCPKCGSNKQKIIKSRLVMVPEILIFLIKKYDNNRNVLETKTKFTEFLNIKKIKYMAVAYIQHTGSLSGGHYYAVCLRKSGGRLQWMTLNDGSVSAADFSPDKNTYLIFYHVYK